MVPDVDVFCYALLKSGVYWLELMMAILLSAYIMGIFYQMIMLLLCDNLAPLVLVHYGLFRAPYFILGVLQSRQ